MALTFARKPQSATNKSSRPRFSGAADRRPLLQACAMRSATISFSLDPPPWAEECMMPRKSRKQEVDAERRVFVLQIVQPGLAGLMDGSVSTLAPVFAAAFATKSTRTAFLVGMAASVGAGISMAF